MNKQKNRVFFSLTAMLLTLLTVFGCLCGCGITDISGSGSGTTAPTTTVENEVTTGNDGTGKEETTLSHTDETTKPQETTKPEETTKADGGNELITPTSTSGYSVLNYVNMKAMWLSQYDLNAIYTSNKAQRSESSYSSLIKNALKKVRDDGFNTVIVQVRPFADSMYPSQYYPMSYIVVGSYGKTATYDPFKIIVDEAHALGLSVQAWINPLRAMLTTEITAVDDSFKIKQWYNDPTKKGTYLVEYSNRQYLNPAYEEVRQLIIDGAKEITEKYDVDGVHIDDYFYPTTDASFDAKAYAAYKSSGGTLTLENFRREELSKLVAGIYSGVKQKNQDVIFGVSPAGNVNTVINSHYADIYTWCSKKGYLDYICPQVYFGFEHATCDFKKVCGQFRDMIKVDGIRLIIGMSLGKALNGSKGTGDTYAGAGKNEWINNRDVLKRCIEYTQTLDKCSGVAYFCYQYFYNPTTGATVSGTLTERNAFIPVLKSIKWD